jgi:hypothetical protein
MGDPHRSEDLREVVEAPQARGSFSFDPDELRALIKKWQDLADSYHDSANSADSMATIQPPGHDFASASHASAANDSGASYIAYLTHNAQYCSQQAELFQAALNDYLEVEDTNAAQFDESNREA